MWFLTDVVLLTVVNDVRTIDEVFERLRGLVIVGSDGRLRRCLDMFVRHSSRLLSRILGSGSCSWLLSLQRVDHGCLSFC
jgi:hypothetical protein